MANVDINPLPVAYRRIPARLRPRPAPIFVDGEPTAEDRELALALLLELDAESRDWYLEGRSEFVGLPVPDDGR
jgi:hypothetical protein